MFTLTVILLMHIILSNTTDTTKSWDHQHLIHNLMNTKMHSAGRWPLCLPTYTNKYKNVLILTIILSGDIELNPGPHVDFVNYQLHGTAREFVAMTVAYGITNPA